MRSYDRLSAQDTGFLFAESQTDHMHVGSLIVFEDAGFSEEDFFEHIESRLHLVPRFRRKLAWVPAAGGWPVWIDDPDFDLRFHIRHTGLARPGDRAQLLKLTGRLMSVRLDRDRPLWELWLVDLPEGRCALVQKTHHCMIDGLSGVDLVTVLLDFSARPKPQKAPPPWQPEEPPSKWELFRDSWRERLTKPKELSRYIKQMSDQTVDWDKVQEITKGLAAVGKTAIDAAPRTSLNQPIGPHRRFEVARVELAQIKAIKNARSCKVNDVVLALVASGLRRILQARGDDIAGLVLKAMVPVSVRDPSKRGTYGNQVSVMKADLPIGEPDPVARLALISAYMDGIKESKQAVGADFWIQKVADFAGPTLVGLASRAAASQRLFNLTVTNVPGPQFPLYLLGGRVLEVYPYVPLFGRVATSAAVISYDGQLNFGFSGDWDVMPDLQVFARGVEEAVEELGG